MSNIHYDINQAENLEELKQALTDVFRNLEERIDQIEGIRGTATIRTRALIDSDANGTILHGFNKE